MSELGFQDPAFMNFVFINGFLPGEADQMAVFQIYGKIMRHEFVRGTTTTAQMMQVLNSLTDEQLTKLKEDCSGVVAFPKR